MKIRQVGAELFHMDGRMDGQTDMTKLTWCFSDRESWIDYVLITNLVHWLLFIH